MLKLGWFDPYKVPAEILPMIEEQARAYAIDPLLAAAMCAQESAFNVRAFRFEPGFYTRYLVGKQRYAGYSAERCSSSYGLMQIMFPTAVDLGYEGEPEGLFVPQVNLHVGCRHVRALLDWANNFAGKSADPSVVVMSALAAYNGGRRGNEPDDKIDRNEKYAKQVMEKFHRFVSRSQQ